MTVKANEPRRRRAAWSISTKVFLAFSATLLVFAGVLSYAVYHLRQTHVEARLIHHCLVPLTLTLSEIHADLTAYDAVLGERDGVLLRKLVQAQRVLYPFAQQLDARVGRASEALAIAEGEPLPPSLLAWAALARQQLSELRGGIGPLEEGMEALRRVVIGDPTSGAVGESQAALRQQISHLQQLTFTLRRDARAQTDSAVRRVDGAERAATVGVAVLSLLAAAVALGIMLVIHRTLRPIRLLTVATGEISRGQYSAKVAVQRMDEVGELAQSFNQMVESIQARDQRLRLLQAYSENILNSVASGIVAVDEETRITHANRAACQLWGLDGSSVLGLRLDQVSPFDLIPTLGEHLRDVLGARRAVVTLPATPLDAPGASSASGEPRRAFGLRDVRPRFNLVLVPLTAPAATTDTGGVPVAPVAPVGALLIGEDVTEELFTRDELIKKERLAAIGRMTSQVTHELRNPLSAMNLNAELLQDELAALGAPPDGEAAELLRSILTEIDRLTSLTEEYLAYARLPVVRTEPTDVGALLRDLLRFLGPDAASRAIALRDQLPQHLPLIQADANQLRRAFLNLIRNAMEAMPDGGVVTVSAPALPAPDAARTLAIELTDSGPGISPEDLAHIFSPFFSTKAAGTGLGLPLTQQIIEEHGGRLLVASHPGQGTAFRVLLPR